jgi:hypothetical protein
VKEGRPVRYSCVRDRHPHGRGDARFSTTFVIAPLSRVYKCATPANGNVRGLLCFRRCGDGFTVSVYADDPGGAGDTAAGFSLRRNHLIISWHATPAAEINAALNSPLPMQNPITLTVLNSSMKYMVSKVLSLFCAITNNRHILPAARNCFRRLVGFTTSDTLWLAAAAFISYLMALGFLFLNVVGRESWLFSALMILFTNILVLAGFVRIFRADNLRVQDNRAVLLFILLSVSMFLNTVFYARAYSIFGLHDGVLDCPKTQAMCINNHCFFDALYFSIITWTTVGYGDITAVNPLSRVFAAIEALNGNIYMALLISALLSSLKLLDGKRDT